MNKYDLFEELLNQYDNGTLDMFLESFTDDTQRSILSPIIYEMASDIIDEESVINEDSSENEIKNKDYYAFLESVLENNIVLQMIQESEAGVVTKAAVREVKPYKSNYIGAMKEKNREMKKANGLGGRVSAFFGAFRSEKKNDTKKETPKRDYGKMSPADELKARAKDSEKGENTSKKTFWQRYRDIRAKRAADIDKKYDKDISKRKSEYDDRVKKVQQKVVNRIHDAESRGEEFKEKQYKKITKVLGDQNTSKESDSQETPQRKKKKLSNSSVISENMSDYDLYKILDKNGYKPTNENLAILKQCLESGTTIILSKGDISLNENCNDDVYKKLLEINDYEISNENIETIKNSLKNKQVLFID